MNTELFRKQSLEKIKSPDNLDEYIRVSTPGIWLLLVSIIILLFGVCVWGIFGRVDSTVPAAVSVENGEAVCYISVQNISSVEPGMTVLLDGYEASIAGMIGNKDDTVVCALTQYVPVPDGFYDGRVVLKSYRPISFILN